ncbi:MAG: arylamine N-acetyltransferase [Ktedonobacterales bacterium]
MRDPDPMPDMATTILDPHAYLERIHCSTVVDRRSLEPSLSLLRDLHLAHLLAVPFENLSIHYSEPITLRDAALYDKIVRRRRGGFCYELNGLFAWLLRQLGFTVTLLSAGVAQANGGFSPEFDHMTLLVHHLDDADWLADVGFGDSFRQPLRLQPDVEQDGADGRRYRLRFGTADGSWLMQQYGESSGWESQYRFVLQPHVMADFADRCHFHQTSPDSHFAQQRVCSLALPDGRITLSDRRLITTLHGVRDERELASEDEYRDVLDERFGVILSSR